MSSGSEYSAGSNLAGGPLWSSSSSGSRAQASTSNINQAWLSLNTTSDLPRSTSLPFTAMGQSFTKSTSTPSGPPPSPSTAQRGLTAAMAGGMRLKRAFAGRRKKSEDVSKVMGRSISGDAVSASAQDYHVQQQRIRATPSSSSSPAQLSTQAFNGTSSRKSSKLPLQQQIPPPPPPKPPSIPAMQPQTPPRRPPPLKPTAEFRSSIIPISPGMSSAVDYIRSGEAERETEKQQVPEVRDNGAKVKAEAKEKEAEKEKEKAVEQGTDGDKGDAADKGGMKDSWRKSDSTMSHHTIRPGSRPSRPVSMAESLQSNHTIVPVGKRQSALITDADFGMPEEDDPASSPEDNYNEAATTNDHSTTPAATINTFSTTDSRHSPTSSLKARDRRSISLNITAHTAFTKPTLPPTPSSASAANLTHSVSEHSAYVAPPAMAPSHSRDAPPSMRTLTNAHGYIAPSSGGVQSTSKDIHGRLAAWTTQPPPPITPTQHQPRSTPNSNPYTTFPPPPEHPASSKPMSRVERSLPALPPHAQQQQTRQPALSMTSGLGLAKRAVEKMGRAWGIGSGSSASHSHTPSTSNSGYSSSSSGQSHNTPPSSYGAPGQHMHMLDGKHAQGQGHGHSSSAGSSAFHELARTSSGQSQSRTPPQQQGGLHASYLQKKNRLKHTQGTPSVSSTTSASTSASDSDAVVAGPSLGKQLRGPMRKGGGGVLFGRDLRSVVRDTGVGVGKPKGWGGRWRNWDEAEEGEAEGERERVGAGEGAGGRTRKGSVRRGQLKALEERKLPALVVRCAQHLLIWGVQEEGLFRVSGRPSHVSRLRGEFDSGADFDMTECSPGDLDPHAVASVFKAFLRELPEPILTNALLPYFDAAMVQENTTNATKDADSGASRSPNPRGPGLPSGPRNTNLPAIRKPPSLSTLAMPSFTGLRPPSQPLLSALQSLLAQLPEENRDLIRTVAELIRATARESRETKMPLSNLLLVFCPSLNMNPPLLRVLCEAEGIWEELVEDAVLDIRKGADGEAEAAEEDGERESLRSGSVGRTSEDVPSSVEYHASTEGGVPRARDFDVGDDASSSMSRPVRQDAHLRKASLAASSVMDDGSSYLSTSEDQDNPARHYSDVHSQSISPPLLTSSAESLETPETSSHHASLLHLPGEDGSKVPQQQGASCPAIVEPSPMELSAITPRRPVISTPVPIAEPVQFPSTASDNLSPLSSKAEKRRSTPILSLPSFSPSISGGLDSPTLSLANRAKRLKKPSLHLLFSKKSSSSISSVRVASSPAQSLRPTISSPYLLASSPYLKAPHSASDSSVSTPLSAVTAPQSRQPSPSRLPPKLETPIESSTLRFGLGLGIDTIETPATPEQNEQAKAGGGSRPLPVIPVSVPQQLPAASVSVTSLIQRGPTPIADRYNRSASPGPSLSLASESQVSLDTAEECQTAIPAHLRRNPTLRSRGFSTSSNASSNHLGLLDDEEQEDWTKSVLLAADVDGGWVIDSRG